MLTCLACEAQPLEVSLDLRGGSCTALDLMAVRVISIEVYGSSSEAEMCTLARRCVFVDVAPTSIDEIGQLLSEVNQPLVDAELAGAEYIHVVGRESCWDQPDPVTGVPPVPPICGANDLAEIDGDLLPLTMRCDASCPAEQVPLCD